MASLLAHWYNFIFRCIPSFEHTSYQKQRENNAKYIARSVNGVNIKLIEINGMEAELLTKEGNDNGIVLYIHGGGFTTGTAKEKRSITQYIVNKYGYNCIAINYRLSPENKWPAQIEDCIHCYKEILSMGYDSKRMIIMGESAGGTLALALPLCCKEEHLPLPCGIVAISASTDNYHCLESHIKNIKTDYMLNDAVSKGLTNELFDHKATKEELMDYRLSPINGNYSGLPPIFLIVSDNETLFDDSRLLYEKLKQQSHKVGIDIQSGLVHAYPIFTDIPESRISIQKAFEFLKENI